MEVDGESKHSEKQISWVAQLDHDQDALSLNKGKRELRCNSKEEDEKGSNSANLAESEQTHDQTTCVKKQLDEKHDTQGVLSPKEETYEDNRSISSRSAGQSENVACSSSDAYNFSSPTSLEKDNLKATSDKGERALKHNILETFIRDKGSNSTSSGTKSKRPKGERALKDINILETIIRDKGSNSTSSGTKSKRPRSNSDSDSDSDSMPSLHTRIKKKYKASPTERQTVPVTESGDNRKELSSDSEHIGEDNDFETPKVRRSVEKRKGSDVSDDQELCSSMHNQAVVRSDVKEGLASKKRKTSEATEAVATSKRKSRKSVKRKINKRPLKTASKMPCDILEGEQG